MSNAHVYLCPHCNSPSMRIPVLEGSPYVCEVCGWSGIDPMVMPFGNPFGSANETFNAFTEEMLNTFSKVAALPMGRILVKWGFVSTNRAGKPDVASLARFIRAMAGGAIMGMIEERKKVEQERIAADVRSSS